MPLSGTLSQYAITKILILYLKEFPLGIIRIISYSIIIYKSPFFILRWT